MMMLALGGRAITIDAKWWLSSLYGSMLLVVLAHAQRHPSISYITQEQIKNIGDTVQLDCSVQYAENYPVQWFKDDNNEIYFLSTGTALIVKDSRFTLRYDESSTTYQLQIKDIQHTDAGIYKCQVSIALHSTLTAQVELIVRQPPVISDNSTQSLVTSEGSRVQMECYAGGYPLPNITWRRENNAILPTDSATFSGNILKIRSVKRKDRGTYYCVADNGVSRADRRNINLEVEFSPVIKVPRPRLGQALSYDMDLECEVEAFPAPSIIWLKDGIQLYDNQHYSISQYTNSDENTHSTLRVITIEKRQYGDYVCKAVNKLGQDEKRVHLFESHIPVCPPACGSSYHTSGAMRRESPASGVLLLLVPGLLLTIVGILGGSVVIVR